MTTFPTIDGIDMPASQLKKLAIPQKVYTRPDDGTIVTYGPQEVSVEILSITRRFRFHQLLRIRG